MPDVIAIVTAVLVVAIAVVLMLAATKSCVFHIRRTATIKASAQKIFPPIGDLQLVAEAQQGCRVHNAAAARCDPAGSSSFLNKVMHEFINLDRRLARRLRQA